VCVCVCLCENARVQMVNLYTVHVRVCLCVCAYVCVYTCVHQFASLLSRSDGLKFDLHMCIRWLKSHIKALTNSQIFEVRDTLSNNIMDEDLSDLRS